jgi:hypothetical protein
MTGRDRGLMSLEPPKVACLSPSPGARRLARGRRFVTPEGGVWPSLLVPESRGIAVDSDRFLAVGDGMSRLGWWLRGLKHRLRRSVGRSKLTREEVGSDQSTERVARTEEADEAWFGIVGMPFISLDRLKTVELKAKRKERAAKRPVSMPSRGTDGTDKADA